MFHVKFPRELHATRVTRACTHRTKEAGRAILAVLVDPLTMILGEAVPPPPPPFLRRVVKHAAPVKGVICNWTVFRAGDQSATSLG